MGEAEERRGQKLLLRRLREMGIDARPLPGGRALVGELRLRAAPFPSPTGRPHDVRQLRFATVGPQHLKCLRPRALFHLPLVSIGGCTSASSVEDRIRAAWSRHLETLRRTAERLDGLGAPWSWEDDGAQLAVPLEVGTDARARMASLRRIALPTPGPLAGMRLAAAAERLFEAPADAETAIDLELAITARLEALARGALRRDALRRLHVPEIVPTPALAPFRRGGHRVLLVGPSLAGSRDLVQALRVRGYQIERARSAVDALQAFARSTFDVVLTDAQLGREEGVDLVPALHALSGVTAVPVVVVDDRLRPARRAAAQQAGAAGYLAHPVDLERIAPGLARMAAGQRGRRFARYPLRLGVRFAESEDAGVTLAVSRRGMFVRTERPSREGDPERLELALPGLSRTLPVLARTLYRVEPAGARDPGLGLRIDLFPCTEDEAAWIALLCGTADDTAA